MPAVSTALPEISNRTKQVKQSGGSWTKKDRVIGSSVSTEAFNKKRMPSGILKILIWGYLDLFTLGRVGTVD